MRLYYAMRRMVAMFNCRFENRPTDELFAVCLIPILHRHNVVRAVTVQLLVYALSSTLTPRSLLQKVLAAVCCRPLFPIISINIYFDSKLGIRRVRFTVRWRRSSFVCFACSVAHASLNFSHSKTALPVLISLCQTGV